MCRQSRAAPLDCQLGGTNHNPETYKPGYSPGPASSVESRTGRDLLHSSHYSTDGRTQGPPLHTTPLLHYSTGGDRSYALRARLERKRCSRMNRSSSRPTAMRSHHEFSRPSKRRAVWIVPKINTPSSVPNIYPIPPLSNVPPMTTQAIASSSLPMP